MKVGVHWKGKNINGHRGLVTVICAEVDFGGEMLTCPQYKAPPPQKSILSFIMSAWASLNTGEPMLELYIRAMCAVNTPRIVHRATFRVVGGLSREHFHNFFTSARL